jgi:anti-sigma B factor antagonist
MDSGALMVSVADGVVRVRGDVDAHTAPRLEDELTAVEGPLVIDLDEVGFMDSSGVAVLVRAHRQRCEDGGLRIIALSRPVRRVLEICAVLDQFDAPRVTVEAACRMPTAHE